MSFVGSVLVCIHTMYVVKAFISSTVDAVVVGVAITRDNTYAMSIISSVVD